MRMRRPSGFAGFTTVWVGQVLSALGTRMTNFALSIWVWQATGRTTDLVLLVFFAFAGTVIFSPIAGALIDRWNRRLTLALSDVGAALATATLLVLFLTGSAEVWHLYVVNAVTGVFVAFQGPAYSAAITLMMDKRSYPRANAMMFAVRSAPVIFSPGLAGAVLSVTSIEAILLADVLSCAIAVAAVFMVQMPEAPRSREAAPLNLWQDSLYGFRYIMRTRPLAWLEGILFAINLFASIGFVLLIPLILAKGASAGELGVVQTIGAVGGVAGVALLSALKPTPHKMRRVLISILLFSVLGRILYGVGDTLFLWAIALLFVHLCIPFIDGYAQSIWQEKVEPAAQGRVFAARQFIEDLTVPIGAVIAGPLVDHVVEPWMRDGRTGAEVFGGLVGTGTGAGIALMFVLIGVLGMLVAVAGFAAPSVRRIETILPDFDAAEPADAPADLPAALELPFARHADPSDPQTSKVPLSLPAAVRTKETALAAFSVVAHRYTGSRDLVVWTRANDLESSLADFLPVRVRFSADPTLADVLGEIRTATAAAPGNPHRDSDNGLVQPDIGVELVERDGRLEGSIRYLTARYERADIERVARDLHRLVEQLESTPDERLSNLSLLDEAQWHQTVVAWNDTATDYPRTSSLPELFEEWADRTPDAPALRHGDVTLSYRELDQRANQLAHHLRRIGIDGEARVGLCFRSSADWVIGALATLKAGGAYVPLDPEYPRERLAYMCGDARLSAVLLRGELAASLPADCGRKVAIDELTDELARESTSRLSQQVDADRLAYVMYTSGSTGRPKGVAVSHRNIVRLVRDTNYVDFRPTDTVAQAANISFDAATFEAWGALLNGATLAGIELEDVLVPDRLRRRLVELGVDVLFLTTSLARQIALDAPGTFASVRHLTFGGEQADTQAVLRLRESCRETALVNGYGPTEGTTFTTAHRCDDTGLDDGDGVVPIGRPVSNTTTYVLDGYLQPVPPGMVGELYAGGDGVALGYLDNPRATADRFVPDPFAAEPGRRLYRTGDLVRQRADGAIEFLGRVDDQVKVSGFRVEPAEIELTLRRSGLLRDVAVRVDRDGNDEARLVAYVVCDDVDAIREHARCELPDYMLPGAFVALPQLPLNANGKVDSNALPSPPWSASREPDADAPMTHTETTLAAIWCEVLGVSAVGVHDNFFELGGRSLKATRVRSRLSAALGVDVPLAIVLEHPTVASLAAAADELAAAVGSSDAETPHTVADAPEAGGLAALLARIEQDAEEAA